MFIVLRKMTSDIFIFLRKVSGSRRTNKLTTFSSDSNLSTCNIRIEDSAHDLTSNMGRLWTHDVHCCAYTNFICNSDSVSEPASSFFFLPFLDRCIRYRTIRADWYSTFNLHVWTCYAFKSVGNTVRFKSSPILASKFIRNTSHI